MPKTEIVTKTSAKDQASHLPKQKRYEQLFNCTQMTYKAQHNTRKMPQYFLEGRFYNPKSKLEISEDLEGNVFPISKGSPSDPPHNTPIINR